MPRPPSWLPRLPEIRRSVENSVRTHYDRAALEQLFQLQTRAASNLLDMLPQVQGPGKSLLVERTALGRFLEEVHATEDVAKLCTNQRAEREKVSRKKPRSLVLREYEAIDPATLSPWLKRGHLEIHFNSVLELFDVLWRIACAIIGDGLEEFCRLYEPEKPLDEEREFLRAEKRALDAEIEQMEADWVRLQATKVPA